MNDYRARMQDYYDDGDYCLIDGEVWTWDEWHYHCSLIESQAVAKFLCSFDDDDTEPTINTTPVAMPELTWHRPIDRVYPEIPF